MSPFSEYKAIASCFYESYNRKDFEKSFENFIAADLINHTMNGSLCREMWLDFDKAFLAACPDLVINIKEQFVEGNKVVTHWTCAGTHTETFYGTPPSGNAIRLTGISIDSIENGKIKEHLAVADFTRFMQQFEKK
jgi:steroid delta-isomerase-like uncharacterized protein